VRARRDGGVSQRLAPTSRASARLRTPATAALATVAAVTGCGAAQAPSEDRFARPTPDAAVRIAFDDGRGDGRRAEIVCAARRDELRGYLRLAPAAETCRRLAEVSGFLTSRPSDDRICTQVYGGPETAHFTGEIGGRQVDRRFSRTDGCEIADWERVEQFLPPAST
jgi:hypothetical protein